MNSVSNPICSAASGHDDAISGPEQDRLDRGVFAKEVYGVATTGPREWSVRIGVYGEWGTGKTSVLKFVEHMARVDDHLVVWFNPWEFRDKRDLWHAFVQTVGDADPSLDPRRHVSRIKRWGARIAEWLSQHSEKIAAAADNRRVTLPLVGVQLLRHYVFSTQKDLQRILGTGRDKRLIVLIDDIDRASSEVVPEMLYAIKEILNIPGISFICAFDPVVVGAVLGDHHPGFGDGLKFLEKIIDYPRWLTDPTEESVLNLVEYDINYYCNYVPLSEMKQVVHLLPRNPRAVRQFTRLLSLLRPQIERHHDHELVWPVILAANVIKIRYPRLAPLLLAGKDFWEEIAAADMFPDDEEAKKASLLEKHVASVLSHSGVPCTDEERKGILASLEQLAERTTIWVGGAESLVYQMHIAEAPAAVTLKEFDEFMNAWRNDGTAATVNKWILSHASLVGRLYNNVYVELFEAALRARQSALSKAWDSIADLDASPGLQQAQDLMRVLRCLTMDLGKLDQKEKRLAAKELNEFVEVMVRHASFTTNEVLREFRHEEKALLVDMAKAWEQDVSAWLDVLKPFSGAMMRDFHGQEAKAIYEELISIILPKFAKRLADGFGVSGFVHSIYARTAEQSFEIRCILLDRNGPLWNGLRSDYLAMLETGVSSKAVQQNSYEMFYWCNYLLRKESGFQDAARMTELMKDDEIRNALWTAATSQPLSFRATVSIRELPAELEKKGISLVLPEWWNSVLAEGGLPPDDEHGLEATEREQKAEEEVS